VLLLLLRRIIWTIEPLGDRKKIRSICESSGGWAHCIPVRRVIDSRAVNANWIVPVSRCIRLSEDLGVRGDITSAIH
jgi:hypothetical protein